VFFCFYHLNKSMPIGNALAAIRSINRDLYPNVSFFTSKINATTNRNPLGGLYIENTSTTLKPTIWFSRETRDRFGDGERFSRITGNASRNNIIIDNVGTTNNNYVRGIAINNNRLMYCVENNSNSRYFVSNLIRPPFWGNDLYPLAGNISFGYFNGRGNVRFNGVNAIDIDSNNIGYMVDTLNNAIRKMIPIYKGINFQRYSEEEYITTLAGQPPTRWTIAYTSNLNAGCVDGSRAIARFNNPYGICVDLEDNIYVADSGNHTIRKITQNGVTITIAGLSGTSGRTDGLGSAARFNYPTKLCCDFDGNIFVSDTRNHTIRKITKTPLTNPITKQYADLDLMGVLSLINSGHNFGDAITMNAAGNVIAIASPKWIYNTHNHGEVGLWTFNEKSRIWETPFRIMGKQYGQFGTAISMNAAGNIFAATSIGGVILGYVRVYRFDEISSRWLQMGQTIDSPSSSSLMFGCSISMNSAGDTFVVGDSNSDSSKGSVLAYSWNSNTSQWVQLGQTVIGTGTNIGLGAFVSINSTGDRFVTTTTTEIKVYNFNQNNSTWELLGQSIPTTATGINASINAAGDKIVTGFIVDAQRIARVYSFNQSTSQWIQLGSDIRNNFTTGMQVLINDNGDRIVVSSQFSDVGSNDTGSVVVYDWDINSSQWVVSTNVNGEFTGDRLGYRIAINASGNRFAASTKFVSTDPNSGYLHVYTYESNKVSYTEQYEYNVTTFAGSGDEGDTEGDYLLARFSYPSDIKMMNTGDLIVSDGNTSPRLKRIKNPISPITNFNITLSSNHYNLDLGYLLRKRGWDGQSPVNCTLTILSGVYVYAASHRHRSFSANDNTQFQSQEPKPALFIENNLNNSTVTIINSGGIIGAGGLIFIDDRNQKRNGGDAIETQANIILKNYGIIGGGGGAGGHVYETRNIKNVHGYGGGGAGFLAGGTTDGLSIPNSIGFTYATIFSGGNGTIDSTSTSSSSGGRGGDLGQDGSIGAFTGFMLGFNFGLDEPTKAGNAIRGISFVTIDPSSTGTMYGPTI
jgi:hypothetical protein